MQQTIGKYQVIEHIASGGQATVFQAFDTSTGRIVALKLLHSHLAENGAYLTRFLREARLAADVAHPNVVRIFEVGREGNTHFIAMEYLPRSLGDLMRGQPQMPIDRVVHIARQIAGALEAARIHGVVHRDIKPPNVLIGPNAEAKLTDFGISRAIEDSPLTRTGAVMGTPQYMSPEQAQGELVDTRSDIYSLGIMLYQMLAGEVPFDADTPFEVIRKHISERARPLRQLRPDTPVALQRIVTRCMAKAPDRRYKTPLDLDEALARAFPDSNATPVDSAPYTEHVEGDGDSDKTITIEVTPEPRLPVLRGPSRWGRAASWVRERRLLVAGVSATAVVLSVGVVAGALLLAGDAPPEVVGDPSSAEPAPTTEPVPTTTRSTPTPGLSPSRPGTLTPNLSDFPKVLWDFTQGAQDWTIDPFGNGYIANVEFTTDGFEFDSVGFDPILQSPGVRYPHGGDLRITVRIKSTSNDDAELSSSSGGAGVRFRVIPDNEWHEYVIEIPSFGDGPPTLLWLEPSTDRGHIAIAWISVEHLSM